MISVISDENSPLNSMTSALTGLTRTAGNPNSCNNVQTSSRSVVTTAFLLSACLLRAEVPPARPARKVLPNGDRSRLHGFSAGH